MSADTTQHAQRMDRMYRFARLTYDVTRRFFLFGRDALLRRLQKRAPASVLEVGCGTGRNLIRLARLLPDARLYGLDLSASMLDAARAKLAARGLQSRVQLAQAPAEQLAPALFAPAPGPFDAVFFSYSLTMIPGWSAALDAALAVLAPGGSLLVVDFWDRQSWPGWFQRWMARRLARFGVVPREEALEKLRALAVNGAKLELESVRGRYAFLAHFASAPASTSPAG